MGQQDQGSEIRAKKEYLRGYEDYTRQIRRIEIEISEIRLNKVCPSLRMSDMPRSHNDSDLSDYAALLDGKESELVKMRYERIKKAQEIRARIELLDSEKEKDVLTNRYILLMPWDAICKKMQYSWRQIHRIHASALQHFQIKEKC